MYKIQVQEEQDFLVFLLCRGMCQEMLFSKYEAWLIHQDPIIEAIDRILIIGLSLLTFLNKKKVENRSIMWSKKIIFIFTKLFIIKKLFIIFFIFYFIFKKLFIFFNFIINFVSC